MAGTVVQTLTKHGRGEYKLTFSWIGDASDGTVPDTDSEYVIDGYITRVVTNPGSPAPTALYGVTLKDTDGLDVMGGELASRSATVTEGAVPKMDATLGDVRVNGLLSFAITSQSVNSAVGTCVIYFRRDE